MDEKIKFPSYHKGNALLVTAIVLIGVIGLLIKSQIGALKMETKLSTVDTVVGSEVAKQAAYGALAGANTWLTGLSSAPNGTSCATTAACTGNNVYTANAFSGGALAQSNSTWSTIGRTDNVASNCGMSASSVSASCSWVIQRTSCDASTGSSNFLITAKGTVNNASAFVTKTISKTWTGSSATPGIFYDLLAGHNCSYFNCTNNENYNSSSSCCQNTVGSPTMTLDSSSTGQTLNFSSGQTGIITGINLIQPVYYNPQSSGTNPGTSTTMCGAVRYTVKLTNVTTGTNKTYTNLIPTDLGVNTNVSLGYQYTCSNIAAFISSSSNYAGPLGNGVSIPSVFTASATSGIPLAGGTSFSAIPGSPFTVNYGDQIYVTASISTTYNNWDVPNGPYNSQNAGCSGGTMWCNVPFRVIGIIPNNCP